MKNRLSHKEKRKLLAKISKEQPYNSAERYALDGNKIVRYHTDSHRGALFLDELYESIDGKKVTTRDAQAEENRMEVEVSTAVRVSGTNCLQGEHLDISLFDCVAGNVRIEADFGIIDGRIVCEFARKPDTDSMDSRRIRQFSWQVVELSANGAQIAALYRKLESENKLSYLL